MYARMTTVQIFSERRAFQPSTVQESLTLWREKVAEIKRARQGFVEAIVLLDHANSQVRTLTVWETEKQMKSLHAEGLFSTLVNAFSDPMAKLPEITYFEVGGRFVQKGADEG